MQPIKPFLLLVLVVVPCALALPTFFDEIDGNRIVGGQTAEPNQFPYQVSLRGAESTRHFCGASIIRDNWVLSAAHCLVNTAPEEIYIVVGAHFRDEQTGAYDVSEIIVHPGYYARDLYNDISLARTTINIVFSATVQPISIGDGEFVGAGLTARSSGWGNLYYQGPGPYELQFLDLVTLTMEDCRARHADNFQHYLTDTVICVYSNEYGMGMCNGDSGGPLTHNGTLIGAVSFGVPCAQGRPDGFTRISVFHSWITDIVD